MTILRPAAERGHFDHGWLDTRHTFSFGDYQDPDWMGFGVLRVINEDRVRPGKGFATHPHRDMEIVTWVLDGALEHRDSMGNGSVIRAGEIQRMSAGTGITHSEFNHSRNDPVHFLQVWIVPKRRGLAPSYEQRAIPADQRRGALKLAASPDGRDGSVRIHQDCRMFVSTLPAGRHLRQAPGPGRRTWLQLTRGTLKLNEFDLGAGDGAGVETGQPIDITAVAEADFLLFDLP